MGNWPVRSSLPETKKKSLYPFQWKPTSQGFYKTIIRLVSAIKIFQLTHEDSICNLKDTVSLSPENPRLLSDDGPGHMNWRLAMVYEHFIVCESWSYYEGRPWNFSPLSVNLMVLALLLRNLKCAPFVVSSKHIMLTTVTGKPESNRDLTHFGFNTVWISVKVENAVYT